jgi:hypothetical protein
MVLTALALGGQALGAGLTALGQRKQEKAIRGVLERQARAQRELNAAEQAAAQRQQQQLGSLGTEHMANQMQFAQALARPEAQQQLQAFQQAGQMQPTQLPGGPVSPQMAQFAQQAQGRVQGLGEAALGAAAAQGALQGMGRADQLSSMDLRNQLLGLGQQASTIDQLGRVAGAERQLGHQELLGDLQRQMARAQQAGGMAQIAGQMLGSVSALPLGMAGGQ